MSSLSCGLHLVAFNCQYIKEECANYVFEQFVSIFIENL